MRRSVSFRFLGLLFCCVAVALACTACQGLSSALGLNPTATAPVYNGIGINVQPGGVAYVDGSPDQSGNVGAKGDGKLAAQQRQVTSIDPKAVGEGLATLADTVLPQGGAKKLVDKGLAALEAGDVDQANRLLAAASALNAAEKLRAKPTPEPTPGAEDAADEPPPTPAPGE